MTDAKIVHLAAPRTDARWQFTDESPEGRTMDAIADIARGRACLPEASVEIRVEAVIALPNGQRVALYIEGLSTAKKAPE